MDATRLEHLEEQVAVRPLASGVANGRRNTTMRGVFCLHIVEEKFDEMAIAFTGRVCIYFVQLLDRVFDIVVEGLVDVEFEGPYYQYGAPIP